MSKEIKELNEDILRITKSVVVHRREYSKFGGFDGYSDIYTMDIAKELYRKGYRKQNAGEWLNVGLANPQCSLCKKYHSFNDNFCPNCGAKMKGGEE